MEILWYSSMRGSTNGGPPGFTIRLGVLDSRARGRRGPQWGFLLSADQPPSPSLSEWADSDASDCGDRDVRSLASAAPPGRPRPPSRGGSDAVVHDTVTLATHRASHESESEVTATGTVAP
jgi:hypothetical protein